MSSSLSKGCFFSRLLLPLCLVTALAAGLYFGTRKAGYFIDEIYSYGLANSDYAPFLRQVAGGSLVDAALTRQDLLDYVAVQEGENFDFFGSVYYNQSEDVHPPLYYFLFHLFSALWGNSFSKWSGLLFNLLFFAGTLFLLWSLAKRMFGRPMLSALTVLLYGLSQLALSNLLYIRMYTLLAFLTVLLARIVLALWDAESRRQPRRPWLLAAAAGAVICLGLLTQYYFVFFAFFLSAFYVILQLIRRRPFAALRYAVWALLGVAAMILIFPPVLKQMTSGALVSGDGALRQLADFSQYIPRLRYYVMGTQSGLWAAVRLSAAALACYLLARFLIRERRSHERLETLNKQIKSGRITWLIGAPALLSLILIALISPVYSLRYIWSLAPLFALMAAWCLYLAGEALLALLPEFGKTLPAILPCCLLLLVFSLWRQGPDNLYTERAEQTALIARYAEAEAACLYLQEDTYEGPTQDLEQLLQFDEVYLTNDLAGQKTGAYISDLDEVPLVVFIDVDETWSSGYDAEALLSAFVAESAYSDYSLLYAYGLSEVYLVTP